MSQQLIFVRHGQADWPGWEKPDDERPLTDSGRAEVERVAQLLVRLSAAPDVILTSPLPRARQTAEIIAKHLQRELREEKLLVPGFRVRELAKIQENYPAQDLMLVGHEEDFSLTIRSLTEGKIKMPKAGVALVKLSAPDRGKLLWLLPPIVATAQDFAPND